MATVNVSMSDTMKTWIDRRTEAGLYADPGDYIRELVRRDQERASRIAAMQVMVNEGLASEVSEETMDDILLSVRSAAGE